MSTIKATIYEAGNGLPGKGALVYDSSGNTVYTVKATSGNISTHGGGLGNSINAELIAAKKSDPTEYSEEEWEEVSDCRVEIAEEAE